MYMRLIKYFLTSPLLVWAGAGFVNYKLFRKGKKMLNKNRFKTVVQIFIGVPYFYITREVYTNGDILKRWKITDKLQEQVKQYLKDNNYLVAQHSVKTFPWLSEFSA